jgi:hypothetical protein
MKEGAFTRPAYGPIHTLPEKPLQDVLVATLGVPTHRLYLSAHPTINFQILIIYVIQFRRAVVNLNDLHNFYDTFTA